MNNRNQNPNCDGAYCNLSFGEVRVLPTGGDGNVILCFACYQHEMAWRRGMNNEERRANDPDAKWQLPAWEDLKIYGRDE